MKGTNLMLSDKPNAMPANAGFFLTIKKTDRSTKEIIKPSRFPSLALIKIDTGQRANRSRILKKFFLLGSMAQITKKLPTSARDGSSRSQNRKGNPVLSAN